MGRPFGMEGSDGGAFVPLIIRVYRYSVQGHINPVDGVVGDGDDFA